MDVSNAEQQGGYELVEVLASLTGLPESWAMQQLNEILENSGHCASELTLDQLRASLVKYLDRFQGEFLEFQENCEPACQVKQSIAAD